MASDVDFPVTRAVARRMAVVAEAATRQTERATLERPEQHALRIVSNRLARTCSRESVAAIFGPESGDDTLATVSISRSTARTYLRALDTVAAGTPTPHERKACTTVFEHVTDHVDPETLGIRSGDLETLSTGEPEAVFS